MYQKGGTETRRKGNEKGCARSGERRREEREERRAEKGTARAGLSWPRSEAAEG